MEFLDVKSQFDDDFRMITLKSCDGKDVYIPFFFLKKNNPNTSFCQELHTPFDHERLRDYCNLISHNTDKRNPYSMIEIAHHFSHIEVKNMCMSLLTPFQKIEAMAKYGFDSHWYKSILYEVKDLVTIKSFRDITPPFYFNFSECNYHSQKIFLNKFCVDPDTGKIRHITIKDPVKMEYKNSCVYLSLFNMTIKLRVQANIRSKSFSDPEGFNKVMGLTSPLKKIDIFNQLSKEDASYDIYLDENFFEYDYTPSSVENTNS